MANAEAVKILSTIDFTKLRRAANEATPEALRAFNKSVRKEVIRLVRRAAVHRVTRRYPGFSVRRKSGKRVDYGKRDLSQDPKPIFKKIMARVKRRRGEDTYLAYCKAVPGYSVFQNYGFRKRNGAGKVAGKFFMQRALANTASSVSPLLKLEFNKRGVN